MGDWEYSLVQNDDTVASNRYVGTNTDVVVPTNFYTK